MINGRCVINIPFTCIFREGQPFKSLETDKQTGAVKRVIFEDVPVDRKQDDQGFRGDSNRMLRILRYLIADFHKENEYDVAQKYEEEPLVCTVRDYVDHAEFRHCVHCNANRIKYIPRPHAHDLQLKTEVCIPRFYTLMVKGKISTCALWTFC